MSHTLKVLHSTAFSVLTGLSRVILAVTVVTVALLGVALLVVPAVFTFVAMEWARARRWFAPR